MLRRLPNWQPLLMSWIESLSSSTHDRERGTALDWVNNAPAQRHSVIRQMADLQRPKLANSKKA
jgi:hypothetical protein